MWWSFVNPAFLYAAIAAVVPLLLHLLQKRRIVTMPFSTVRFLKLAQKRSSSRIRMENFLLWLIRTLLLLALAAAFALPIIRTTSFGGFLGNSQRDIAIVWDVSYSMDYSSGRKKVWDLSRETVLAILEGLQKGDKACLYLAHENVTPLIEQPSGELDSIAAQVKAQEIKLTTSRLGEATLAACSALNDSGNREREVYIVTDGQRLPWTDFGKTDTPAAGGETNAADAVGALAWNPEKIDKKIVFFIALLGAASPENVAPVALDVQPTSLMADTPAKVSVRLAHTGPNQDISVAITVDEKEVNRRAVPLESEMGDDVVFSIPPLPVGNHECRVETPPDGLPIDNTFHFLLRVREKLPVLCVGSDEDMFFLSRALNPVEKNSALGETSPGNGGDASTLEVRKVKPDELAAIEPSGYLCIFLCNALPLPAQAILTLEQYVKQGGVVVLFPGDRAAMSDYESWSFLPAKPDRIADVADKSQTRSLRLVNPGDRIFSGLKLPPGTLPAVVVRREIQWKPLDALSTVLLSGGDNLPFLLSRSFGNGRVIAFSVSADRKWSNLPLSPFFLPFVHQIVQFGAGQGGEKLFVWAGRDFPLSDTLPGFPENAELLSSDDGKIPLRKQKTDAGTALFVDDLTHPGIYRMRTAGETTPKPALAVNVLRDESNLTRIPKDEAAKAMGVGSVAIAEDKEELLKLIQEHRLGRPLAENLLWLVMLLAILELWMANRASRKSTALTDQLTIESSGRVKGKA